MLELEQYKHYYLLNIGEPEMASLAEILLHEGFRVSGFNYRDSKYIEGLIAHGADIEIKSELEVSDLSDADCVVYSVLTDHSNPKLETVNRMGIPIYRREEILGVWMRQKKHRIVICGESGAKMAASYLALILGRMKMNPTVLWDTFYTENLDSVHISGGDHLIMVCDMVQERLLDLYPTMLVITDIMNDLDNEYQPGTYQMMMRSYEEAIRLRLPGNGTLVIGEGHFWSGDVLATAAAVGRDCKTYGVPETSDYHLGNVGFRIQQQLEFEVYEREECLGEIRMALPRRLHIESILAAIACALSLEFPMDEIAHYLYSNPPAVGDDVRTRCNFRRRIREWL